MGRLRFTSEGRVLCNWAAASLILVIVMLSSASSNAALREVVFRLFFTVTADGKVVRPPPLPQAPASLDAATNVQSTDVVINQSTSVSARLYRPMKAPAGTSIPLLIYFHGGGFAIGSAFDLVLHTSMNKISSAGNVAILSVNHRLAPEHPVNDLYDDGYDAVTWVSQQATGQGWMKDGVDYEDIFLGGQSSGGNIAHNVGMRMQELKPAGLKLRGLIIVHPYVLTAEPLPSLLRLQDVEMRNNITGLWKYVCPGTSGLDDPRVNPSLEPDLQVLKPGKVLICVAELDPMIDAAKAYYEALKWNGVDTVYYETMGRRHGFNLMDPDSADAQALQSKIVSYMQWAVSSRQL